MRFILKTGRIYTFRYADVIHLRKDFNSNEFFGDSPAQALAPLMEIVTTTDQGIVKAIKNSNIIKWLLKIVSGNRPEDVKKTADQFVKDYMNIESTSVGAAAVGANVDAIQVAPNDYVPNAIQMDRTVQRILSFYNTNSHIVQGDYTEDEWISYYESALEADVIQLSNEFTRKLFSRKERGFGNKIIFDGSNLSFASMQTKLGLVQYVDRGIMSPNEVRDTLSMAPREGGDEFLLRKDTGTTGDQGKGGNN